MFVTSDEFNLKTVARSRGIEWRENLICGIAVEGREWPGADAAARFMLEAARRCDLLPDLQYSGFQRLVDERTQQISIEAFEQLARGELPEAEDAFGVMLRGESEAPGAGAGVTVFGGHAYARLTLKAYPKRVAAPGPPWQYMADFIFPLRDDSIAAAQDLLQLSVDLLGAEYGYFFVRDQLFDPWIYTIGGFTPDNYKIVGRDDADKIREWADLIESGQLWSGDPPMMRDLYQVNLLSDYHRSIDLGGVPDLIQWIRQDPERGDLKDLGHGRFAWTLTDMELFKVRDLLRNTGLFMSRNVANRIYRDLPLSINDYYPGASSRLRDHLPPYPPE